MLICFLYSYFLVQKRVQERTPDSVNKPVIPASVQEEGESGGGGEEDVHLNYRDRNRGDRRSGSGGGESTISNNSSSQQQYNNMSNSSTGANSITSIQKQLLESSGSGGERNISQISLESIQKQRIQAAQQLQMTAAGMLHGLQQQQQQGQVGGDRGTSNSINSELLSKMGLGQLQGHGGGGHNNEEDHYRR